MTTDEIVAWANGQGRNGVRLVHPRSYEALNQSAPLCACGKKTALFSRWVPDEDRALETLATGTVASRVAPDGVVIPTDVYWCQCGFYSAVSLSFPSEEARRFLAERYSGVSLFGCTHDR